MCLAVNSDKPFQLLAYSLISFGGNNNALHAHLHPPTARADPMRKTGNLFEVDGQDKPNLGSRRRIGHGGRRGLSSRCLLQEPPRQSVKLEAATGGASVVQLFCFSCLQQTCGVRLPPPLAGRKQAGGKAAAATALGAVDAWSKGDMGVDTVQYRYKQVCECATDTAPLLSRSRHPSSRLRPSHIIQRQTPQRLRRSVHHLLWLSGGHGSGVGMGGGRHFCLTLLLGPGVFPVSRNGKCGPFVFFLILARSQRTCAL